MHHAALNRPRPHDGDFNHQVVKTARLQARQHAHLRAAFDLEHTHRVGLADHVVSGGVFRRDVLHLEAVASLGADEIQAAADGAQHAQGQHVHLQQTHGVEVVLVPLDDASIGHGGVLHRHQARQLALRQHKTADVLREVARRAHHLAGQLQPLLKLRRCRARLVISVSVKTRFSQLLLQCFAIHQRAVKPMVVFGDDVDQRLIEPQRHADVADRAAAAVGDHGGGNRSAIPSIL